MSPTHRPLSPLSPPSPSLSEAETPQYTLARTTNVGDADVKRHRYLTVTHSAPLYPHHHNCNTLLTSQHPPPLYTLVNVFLFPSSIYCISARKVRGTFQDKGWKMKIEGLKTPTHISLLFEAVRSRWQGRENEVEIHIVRCVFKFQESVRF